MTHWLVWLVSNDKLKYLCIEAAEEFFNELEKNTESLKSQNADLQIRIVKQFVGKDVDNVNLVGVGGTKHAAIDGGEIKSKTLSHLLNDLNIEHSELALFNS